MASLLDAMWKTALSETPINHPKIQSILKEVLQQRLDDDLRRRAGRPEKAVYTAGWFDEGEHDELNAELALIREQMDSDRYDIKAGRSPGRMEQAEELLKQHGLPPDLVDILALGLAEASLKAWETIERRTLGQEPLLFTSREACRPVAAEPIAPPDAPDKGNDWPTGSSEGEHQVMAAGTAPSEKFSELITPFIKNREVKDGATQQVLNQERGTLRRFIEACGDRKPAEYLRKDIGHFLDTLRRLPATYGKSPKDKDLTIEQLIQRADASDAPRLKEKTIKRHHSALSQFFLFAVNKGHLSLAHKRELTEEPGFGDIGNARGQRDEWSIGELQALFASPIWTGSHRYVRSRAGDEVLRDANFWLPLLALFTGARLEELADIRKQDVRVVDGVPVVLIVPFENRRLKNNNAERTIPLHEELLRIGFMEFAEGVEGGPDSPVFPELEPQGPDQRRGPRFTRFFVNYRRQIGIYRPGVGMHAFRHTSNTRMRNLITTFQHERHVAFLFGHSQGGGEGRERYDKGPGLKAMAETLALLRYPELNLSRLYLPEKTGAG